MASNYQHGSWGNMTKLFTTKLINDNKLFGMKFDF